ncbi:hypothetical protein SAMN04489731_102560 [Amycolatopsis regifaucium]|nr:hypothetical protein SAMN04489731_102560 [Amycolatopsis regifaucium]
MVGHDPVRIECWRVRPPGPTCAVAIRYEATVHIAAISE